MPKRPSKAFSINRLAEITGIDRRTLKRRLADVGLSGGPWTVPNLLKALLCSPGADPELADLRRERLRSQNRILSAEAARTEGRMANLDEVEQGWMAGLLRLRDSLLRLPGALSGRVAYLRTETEVENLLRTAIEEALTELSKPLSEEEWAKWQALVAAGLAQGLPVPAGNGDVAEEKYENRSQD